MSQVTIEAQTFICGFPHPSLTLRFFGMARHLFENTVKDTVDASPGPASDRVASPGHASVESPWQAASDALAASPPTDSALDSPANLNPPGSASGVGDATAGTSTSYSANPADQAKAEAKKQKAMKQQEQQQEQEQEQEQQQEEEEEAR